MIIKVETEKKYYCMEPERLTKMALEYDFKEVEKVLENDEYFTDINSEYIKNRTCLRIRLHNEETMEITYKGKSSSLLGQYCKLENNIRGNINDYDNYVKLFSNLGFYSYVNVQKTRTTYSMSNEKYQYSIMVDKLENIGGFVEFEIVSKQEDSNREELNRELSLFVSKFDSLNLNEATKPYRDIVANYIYSNLNSSNNATDIFIDVDEEISYLEKDFYKKYKDKIINKCGSKASWGMYKKDINIALKVTDFIDDYIDNLIIDSNQLMVTIYLLNKLEYKKHFTTKVNKVFFNHLFGKLNIDLDNVIYLLDDTINNELKKNGFDPKKQIIINSKNIKTINSELLILINNK